MNERISRRAFLVGSAAGAFTLACFGSGDEPVVVIHQEEPHTENLSQPMLEEVARESALEFSKAFGISVNPEEIAASTKLTITPEEFKQAQNLFDTTYKSGREEPTTFFIAERRLNTPKRIYINGPDMENIFKGHTQDYPSAESKRDFLKGIMFIAISDYSSAEYASHDFSQVIFGSNYSFKPEGQRVDELGEDVYVDGAILKFHENGLYLPLLRSVEMAESLKIAKYLFDLDKRAAKIHFLRGFGLPEEIFVLHDELFAKLYVNYSEGQRIRELVRIRVTDGERERLFEQVGRQFGGKSAKVPAMLYGFLVFSAISIGDIKGFRQRVAE